MTSSTKDSNIVESRENWVSTSIFRKTLAAILTMVVAGIALSPLEQKLWGVTKDNIPKSYWDTPAGQAGQGMLLATLGGFRSLLADLQWLRTTSAWDKEDTAKTLASIQFTVAIDPRPAFFWRNGARMIGYDMRHWDSAIDGIGNGSQEAASEELALAAINFLRLAMRQHPEDYTFPVDIGHIYMNRLNDYEAAAATYLFVHENYPEAPYYIGRLHAQLLQKAGKLAEAYKFLTRAYEKLPAKDPYARKELVLRRIRSLERKLKVPPENRVKP